MSNETMRQDAALLADHYEQVNATLARSIHDGAAQKLTAALMELSLCKEDAAGGHAVSPELIQSLIETLQSLSADIRSVASTLRPRALDLFGLEAVIESLASSIGCRFTPAEHKVPPADRTGIHMARIAAALLADVPEGRGAAVAITSSEGSLVLRVSGEAGLAIDVPSHVSARVRAFDGKIEQHAEGITVVLPAM
jgi:signal transduction histidine kinase